MRMMKDQLLEIRAGAGGDEAGIFSGNLFRMYSRLAEREKWIIEIISQKDAEHGGFKEIIAKISGKLVYKTLKFESEFIGFKEFLKLNHKVESTHQHVLLLFFLRQKK